VAQPPSAVVRPQSITAEGGGATILTAMPTQPAPSLPPREHGAFAAAAPALAPSNPMPTMSIAPSSREDDVVDLPAGPLTSGVIIGAVMRSVAGEYIECPVKPPMNADASIAVGRDRRLVIVAVAQQGLSDLRAIGRAYQWLTENRALVAMAVPQLSIDAMQMPRLQLLVDQQDLSADILQPMLQSGNVLVQAYRKLKWAGRTGLLLNAA
jgi:hypothetical protein